MTRIKPSDRPVYPLTIGPGNAVDVCGVPWRWLRDFARGAGVPVWRVGAKTVIPAAPLAALERAAEQAPARELSFEEELAARRAALGLELVPGSPPLTEEEADASLRKLLQVKR
jgi:hypothetical protein